MNSIITKDAEGKLGNIYDLLHWDGDFHLPMIIPDGSRWPQISVVTPSYNQGVFLEQAIRSILSQGYPNLEFIIIDGGSTDNSVDIIKKYASHISYWVSETDRGQSHAVNKGIQRANGDLLFWLNADDLSLPGSLRLVAETFQANPGRHMVTGQAHVIDEDGNIVGELPSRFTSWKNMLTEPLNMFRQVSTFFSRRLFDELGLLNETLDIAMDTELLIRFTQHYRPLILKEYLSAYRMHADAKSISQRLKGRVEADRVRERYFLNRKMADIYHDRSSEKWLQLSRSSELKPLERITCLCHALRNQPSVFFRRSFGSSVKKLLMEGISTVFKARQFTN